VLGLFDIVNQMVNDEIVALDRILYAISDDTRRKIVDTLYRGEKSIAELRELFAISAPAVTKHMNILRKTGLVRTRKEGRVVVCTLETDNLMRVATWLARFEKLWEKRLSALKQEIGSNMGRNNL
jgi:DNA-binding transcriptional ArsR family regulator